VCLFGLFSLAAQGAIVTYTNHAQFLAALNAATTYEDNFDNVASGALATSVTKSRNGLSYQISAPGGLFGSTVGGDRSIGLQIATNTLSFTNFTGGINAFGGYFYFDNNSNGINTLGAGTVSASNGVDTAVLAISAPTTTTSFFGFISTTGKLTSISGARNSGGVGFLSADDVIVANVPEPAAMGLVFAGLACLVAARSRRA